VLCGLKEVAQIRLPTFYCSYKNSRQPLNRLFVLYLENKLSQEIIMGIIGWIIIGAIAGWLASMVTGNDKKMGAFANITVGIIGGLIGGFIMFLLGGTGISGFNLWSLLIAFIGSLIVLWIFNKIHK
jgi:uncharacterized membrane protein YeaQ/YmgE (transglycosylase-associated protein family)